MSGSPCLDGPSPVLIFLHNMRTAGDTLRTLITRQYRPREIVEVTGKHDTLGSIRGIELIERARLSLVQGHIPYGLHKRIAPPTTYVTMLRRPIERVVSLYHHVLEDPSSGDHRRAGQHLGSLEAFVTSGIFSEVDNGQTRRISGLHHEYGRCTQEMLDLAKRHLERDVAVVGLTERFDESVLLMQRAFGWRNVLYHRVNATSTRVRIEDLAPETVELVERYNRLDQQLYQFAETLLREAVSRQGVAFERELRQFKLLNGELANRPAPDPTSQVVPNAASDVAGAPEPERWNFLLDAHAEALAREYDLIKEIFRLRRREERSVQKHALLRKRNKILRMQLEGLGVDPGPDATP